MSSSNSSDSRPVEPPLVICNFAFERSASRQMFDLSRTGFFPPLFARINGRGIPVFAFLFVALVGFAVSFVNPERVLLLIVLLFTSTYVLVALAFIRLRKTRADVPRAYTARGGMFTAVVTLLISVVICYACFNIDWIMLAAVLVVFAYAAVHKWKGATQGKCGQ